MQHTDIFLIEQFLAAKKYGDNTATKTLLKELSPEIRPLLEVYISGRCASEYPPALVAWNAFYECKWTESLRLFTSVCRWLG